MNLSGILVTVDPAGTQAVLASLAALPGVEVWQHDAQLGRIVVVQEAPDVGAEVAGFMQIRELPHVVNADLVCHCLDVNDSADATDSTAVAEPPAPDACAAAGPPA